jgi:hypothetical protein
MNNNDFFVIADILPGKLNALVKNIMKQTGVTDPNEAVRMVNAGEVQISLSNPKCNEKDGVIRFLVTSNSATGDQEGLENLIQGELIISDLSKKWRPKGDKIYFRVISDGTTGEQWITRLESKGYEIAHGAKSLLRSKDFQPTTGVVTEIAVLEGRGLFPLTTKKIREQAKDKKFLTPNAEVSCLICEMFMKEDLKDMGLIMIITMHEPIKASGWGSGLLYIDGTWLGAKFEKSDCDDKWPYQYGFAFVVSQVKL